ncbi:MAG: thioredoxin domain-containing protein, partial [Dehalococcoidia bacterium]|nr:thioredoxin domain-containing protein [Dehalococcoidia bacterium]
MSTGILSGGGLVPNRLIGETSPYLLQHAHNPVDWYPWGEEALERARKDDKPILLSIGYAACHWCHVMERECFENPDIALLMNELFISIKVDREERPDIDAVYMEAVQAMTGGGGWPLTVFLSPDGKAFFGGTYFPPRDISNLPGFPRVLLAIAEAYRGKRAEIAEIGEQVFSHVKQGLQAAPAGESLAEDTLARAYHGLRGVFDYENGGLGGAP